MASDKHRHKHNADQDSPEVRDAMGEEFISEIGSVGEPDIIEDDYVGPDGHPRPHQEPGEVREETDRVLDRRFEHSENIQESES